MADTLYEGRTELLYLNGGGAPGTDPDEVTSYVQVLYVEDYTMSITSDELEAIHKNASGFVDSAIGLKRYTITGTAYLSRDGNTGHTILYNAVVATSSTNQTVGWIKSTNTLNDFQNRGEAKLTTYDHSSPANDYVKFSFTMRGVGAPTREAVD